MSGATPKTSESSYWDGTIAWATPKDLSGLGGTYIASTNRTLTDEGLAACAAQVLPVRSVLFSSRAPIGLVAINTVPMATNQGFKSLVPKDGVLAEYIYWWLRINRDYLQRLGTGATFKEVSKAVVSRVELPVPDASIQEGVVARLELMDRAQRIRSQSVARITELRGSLFAKRFGDALSNPRNFQRRRLGDLASRMSDGPFGSNLKSEHYVSEGIRVVRLQNIGVGRFLDSDQAFVSPSHFNSLVKHECLPGDVLVATLGDPNLRACRQPAWIEQALNKADCVQIRVDPNEAVPEYVEALLNDPGTELLAQRLVRGQTRQRISMGRLREMQVPVPPLDEQRAFADEIRTVDQMLESTQRSASRLAELQQVIEATAFLGAG